MFVGLELELEGLVTLLQQLVLVLGGLELLLGGLILLLEVGYQLLELHAADLRLQLLRQLPGHFVLLADQVDDDEEHEVDQEDSPLYDMLLGFREALGGVPSGALQEEVMNAAVQLAVQLAQVLPAVSLGDAVFFALVVGLA